MTEFNKDFDALIQIKNKEINELYNNMTKNKKMIENTDDINYSVRTTVSKINAEIVRKEKASKNYRKKQGNMQE